MDPSYLLSILWLSIAAVASVVLAIILLRLYASLSCPWWVFVIVGFGWSLSVVGVAVLPLDLAVSVSRDQSLDVTEDVTTTAMISIFWRVVYWSTFFMTWIVAPFFQSYFSSGGFTIFDKIKYSLKSNLLFYGIVASALIIYLIIVAVLEGMTMNDVQLFGMALSQIWGLLLLFLLLGHGLVEFPRSFWSHASLEQTLRACYYQAGVCDEDTVEAKLELRKVLGDIRRADQSVSPSDKLRVSVDLLSKECSDVWAVVPSHDFRDSAATKVSGDPFRYSDLVELNRLVKDAKQRYFRLKYSWEVLVDKVIVLQNILQYESDLQKKLLDEGTISCAMSMWMRWRRWFAVTGRAVFYKGYTIFLGLLSLALIWSETVAVVDSPDLSIPSLMLNYIDLPFSCFVLLAFVWIAYLGWCAYWSLFRLRVFEYYRLTSGNLSSASSLMFSCSYVCRLMPPLCYNFSALIHQETGSGFSTAMGAITRIDSLNNIYSFYLPLLLVILALCNLFHVFGRIMRFFGFPRLEFSDEEVEDSVQKGSQLMINAVERRLRDVISSSDNDADAGQGHVLDTFGFGWQGNSTSTTIESSKLVPSKLASTKDKRYGSV